MLWTRCRDIRTFLHLGYVPVFFVMMSFKERVRFMFEFFYAIMSFSTCEALKSWAANGGKFAIAKFVIFGIAQYDCHMFDYACSLSFATRFMLRCFVLQRNLSQRWWVPALARHWGAELAAGVIVQLPNLSLFIEEFVTAKCQVDMISFFVLSH